MNMKNTARVFFGLIIAAAFVLTACDQPNSTTPAPDSKKLEDQLGIKDKIGPALKEAFKSNSAIDLSKEPFELKDDLTFTATGLTFGTVTDVTLEKVEVTPKNGSVRAAGNVLKVFKQKANEGPFTVKLTFKKGDKKTEYELKVVNKGQKGLVNLELCTSADKNVNVHGVESKQSSLPNSTVIEVPANVAKLDPKMIKIAFKDFGFITASEVKNEGGTAAALDLTTSEQTYTVKFAASDFYNEKSVQLKVKKAAATTPSVPLTDRTVDSSKDSNILGIELKLASPYTADIEVPATAELKPANIKVAFTGVSDLVAATEIKDSTGSGDAPALAETVNTYTVKFAETTKYNAFELKLKIKKAASGSQPPQTQNFTGLNEAAVKAFIKGVAGQNSVALDTFPITSTLKLPKAAQHSGVAVTIAWALNPALQEGVKLAAGTSEDTLSFTANGAAGKGVTLKATISATSYNPAEVAVTITTAALKQFPTDGGLNGKLVALIKDGSQSSLDLAHLSKTTNATVTLPADKTISVGDSAPVADVAVTWKLEPSKANGAVFASPTLTLSAVNVDSGAVTVKATAVLSKLGYENKEEDVSFIVNKDFTAENVSQDKILAALKAAAPSQSTLDLANVSKATFSSGLTLPVANFELDGIANVSAVWTIKTNASGDTATYNEPTLTISGVTADQTITMEGTFSCAGYNPMKGTFTITVKD